MSRKVKKICVWFKTTFYFIISCICLLHVKYRPNQRLNHQQKDRLINIMEENFVYLYGLNRGPCVLQVRDDMWTQIATELNGLGMGAVRTPKEWRHCFTNMRLIVQEKLRKSDVQLSEMDKKIIRICWPHYLKKPQIASAVATASASAAKATSYRRAPSKIVVAAAKLPLTSPQLTSSPPIALVSLPPPTPSAATAPHPVVTASPRSTAAPQQARRRIVSNRKETMGNLGKLSIAYQHKQLLETRKMVRLLREQNKKMMLLLEATLQQNALLLAERSGASKDA